MDKADKAWQAEADLDALIRSKDIEADRSRVNQAREVASRRVEQYGEMARKLAPSNLGFNNTVKGSKMFGGKK
jgi:hypothetical protein